MFVFIFIALLPVFRRIVENIKNCVIYNCECATYYFTFAIMLYYIKVEEGNGNMHL